MLSKYTHLDVSPILQNLRIKLDIFKTFINYFKSPVTDYSVWILYDKKLI